MIDIILSIHPKWAEKIYSGEKSVEVRKTKPDFNKFEWINSPKIYLYETTPIKKITGYVYLEDIKWGNTAQSNYLYWEDGGTCLTSKQLDEYAKGKLVCFWQLENPQNFDIPKDIKGSVPQSWRYLKEGERYD